jgi:chemotaxis protein CheD
MTNLLRNSRGKDQTPPCLPGFEHIGRYLDRSADKPIAKILPGEYYVTVEDEMILTVLGSCVSACIRDRVFGIGGMNHFLLPEGVDSTGNCVSASYRYGNYAMEHMINDILKYGGQRKNLEAKITGGGQIIQGMTAIGSRNIEFVRSYLENEGIALVGEDVGDIFPRKVIYMPRSGKVKVKKLASLNETNVLDQERAYRRELEKQPVEGSVELF